ncbi:kinase [Dysgonomonas sp. Marseille-P4677]|uniref:helix-hairpin-helix domain-containing protein n=1 Tax=Dysgonomonas sp. Marseille-P4677 TaxID=2364790 RepID=UPI0019120E0A|nr:kinase [Dysgonomonas sp. Marseille-P4677]MBK5720883.1 kinase [Dysgonomonas sp. Marseille-P4677]
MANIIKIRATDGSPVEFVDEIIGSGAMKDVYFSPDKSYVVGFFREKQDYNAKDRLENITGIYRERIFKQEGGEYWKDSFCWPTKMVEYKGKIGVVCPTYQSQYFFKYGSVNNDFLGIKGKEKEGKWFASAKNQNRFLAPEERGVWFKYFQICIRISRAVKRLHAAGLAHSDLSYKNVLVDPISGQASIIDIDGLVIPGKFPPDVLGTPDFIAPEVIATKHLDIKDPERKLPSIRTDRHALAVMIYMYLLYRHPLRGGKVNDLDSSKDEELSMGSKALFIEHPTDISNSVKSHQLESSQLPQADPVKIPYTVCGPYLVDLFKKAFIDGLHNPSLRPTANEWEDGLLKTIDLMQPCQNPKCWYKWFVFDNSTKPKCPFCGTEYKGQLPVLNLYSSRNAENYTSDNYRLMVYNNQYLYQWHVNRNLSPNERLTEEQKKPVGYFVFHQGRWLLVNQRLTDLEDKTDRKKIEINEAVELTDNKQILLSKEEGGRLVIVQLVSN